MTTNKATYTSTKEKRTADAPTYTVQPMATPFGWQGQKARRAAQAPPRASARSLGNVEPGRLADFEKGRREAFDAKARTAAIMVGTYVGVKAWSAWRGHQREQGR